MCFVQAQEFELVCHSTMFFEYFKRPYSFVVEFFAGLVCFEILGVKPYLVSNFEVIRSSASVIKPLHVFSGLFKGHFCFLEDSCHLCYEISRLFLSLP